MTNPRLDTSEEHNTSNKRKRVLAAVAEDLVTSEDDDNVADGMDISDIIESHTMQHRQTATSKALHALGETIRNTLLEINEIREQNRERRHRELLEVLTKIVQHDSNNRTDIISTKSTNFEENLTENNQQNQDKQNATEMDLLENQQFVTNPGEIKDTGTHDLFNDSQGTLSKPVNNQQTPALVVNSSPQEVLANNTNTNFNETEQSIRVACSFNKNPNNCVKLLKNSTNCNQPQLNKIKKVIVVKPSNTKEELQKMRAQMLEIQRQKMEDRERKKRESLQMQNK